MSYFLNYTIHNCSRESISIQQNSGLCLETLSLLNGLFLTIGGISNMGVIDALGQLPAKLDA